MLWSSLPASTTLVLIVYNVSTTEVFVIVLPHLLRLPLNYRLCMPALQLAAEDLRQAIQHAGVEVPSAGVVAPRVHPQEVVAVVQEKGKRETTEAREVREMEMATPNQTRPQRKILVLNAQSGRKTEVGGRYWQCARIYLIQRKQSCEYFTIRRYLTSLWECLTK
jgi:hypothetical protein